MIVARDVDRIRQMMGNQPPEHLWCDWQCCCWIPSGSLHTHPCQNTSFSLAAFPTLSGLGFLLIQAAARVGTGGSDFSSSALAGSQGQPDKECTGSIYLFCSDIALCLLIILWWLSTGRKGRNVWCCSIMSWKCSASGQTHCIYLMVGRWKNVRHWGHFGALWASQKAGWCKSKEALGVVDTQPKCSVLLAAEVFCLSSPLGSPKLFGGSSRMPGFWHWPLGLWEHGWWGAPGLAGWGCRDVHCSASLLQV